jgi:hypothetical protein
MSRNYKLSALPTLHVIYHCGNTTANSISEYTYTDSNCTNSIGDGLQKLPFAAD